MASRWLMLLLTMILLLPATSLRAADEDQATEESGYPAFSGSVSLGFLSSSGNTDTESANFEVGAQLEYERWRHTVGLTARRASEDGETNAERYTASAQTDYKFTERSYAFAAVAWERDLFGAFERRRTISAGIGRTFIDTSDTRLDLEAGVGQRVQEPQDGDDEIKETVVRLREALVWNFSDTGAFKQSLLVESGSSNTFTEAITSVTTKLTGALSWKLSYTLQHNTDVPVGTENTDTFTSISLEYAF